MEQKRAVIIGINDYDDPGFERLKYAEKDARAVYEALVNPDIGDFAKDNITLLTGSQNWANTVDLRRSLRAWVSSHAHKSFFTRYQRQTGARGYQVEPDDILQRHQRAGLVIHAVV